jgi:hypothetical protein
VLTPMVSAEQQLPTYGQGRANVGLGAASVASVECRQRLGGGESSSHVSPFGSPPLPWGTRRQSLETTSNPAWTFPTTPSLRRERNVAISAAVRA